MSENTTREVAELNRYGNDLIWSYFSREAMRTIRWNGYNDTYWWANVADSEQFSVIRLSAELAYRLNPHDCTVQKL